MKLTINEEKTRGHINPEIYGHFSEHLGRCIYGGIFVGENSDIPNVNGMRTDVVDALKEIKIPSGVTKLEKGIVEDCSSLETLVLPSSLTEVVDNPFKGCSKLKLICVENESLPKEVSSNLQKYIDKNFVKGQVKLKTGAVLATATSAVDTAGKLGAGLGSLLGKLGEQVKQNEQVQNTVKETKDAFKKAFGGLFGKK